MGGEGKLVQIDESLFRGKRKSNRGRLKAGDLKEPENEKDKLIASKTHNKSKRNYGSRMEGSWVFGMVIQDQRILEKNQKKIAANKIKKKYVIRTLFPFEKEARKKCYKDGRKSNTKNQRIYESKNGKYSNINCLINQINKKIKQNNLNKVLNLENTNRFILKSTQVI